MDETGRLVIYNLFSLIYIQKPLISLLVYWALSVRKGTLEVQTNLRIISHC